MGQLDHLRGRLAELEQRVDALEAAHGAGQDAAKPASSPEPDSEPSAPAEPVMKAQPAKKAAPAKTPARTTEQ